MIDFNALLAQHPEIAKYLLILFVVSEFLGMLPETITKATGVISAISLMLKSLKATKQDPPSLPPAA